MSKTLIFFILFTALLQSKAQAQPTQKEQADKQAIESCVTESMIEGEDQDLDESEALEYCTNLSKNNEI